MFIALDLQVCFGCKAINTAPAGCSTYILKSFPLARVYAACNAESGGSSKEEQLETPDRPERGLAAHAE